jgi:U3 small nucleolar RNA-associated protein 25
VSGLHANTCRGGSVDGADFPDEGSDEDNEQLDDESGSDDEAPAVNSYSSLLQILNAHQAQAGPSRKRRKLSSGHRDAYLSMNLDEKVATNDRAEESSVQKVLEDNAADLEVPNEEDDNNEEEEPASDDEGEGLDPFEQHFSGVDDQLLAACIASVEAKKVTSTRKTMTETSVTISNFKSWPEHDRDFKDFSMKKRLETSAATLAGKLVKSERHIANSVLSYRDIICGTRDLRNAGRLRDLTALHALNHIFKTRDRVIKNNAKLSQQADDDSLDLRDQGFTRPKVLVVLPTRNTCVKFVDSIVRLSEAEQQENKSRFTAGFADQDGRTWDDKPEDFQDLFSGNDDDMFRLGLKFTRRTIKYFSSFYNSDIILASPLGLMRAIEGSSSKDEKKKHDADFLSSIEIVIVDHTNALLMQNWQHVEYIFSQLNLLPKESRDCDFSRVQNWYLEGHAKYLRQTIILSDYVSPEINSLASTHLHNIAGSAKYKPIYPGDMLKLPPTLPQGISQTFTRIHSPSPLTDADARFTHFTSTILPTLLHSHQKQSTLIYLPTYTDFVRLRNHLSTSQSTVSLSFGTISEYTSVRDVTRARSHFFNGRHSVLLYTERAHHFRRYNIRGVKKVVFYGVPENPLFWGEITGFLGLNDVDEKVGKGAVKAIFSKWDVLKFERIVGTERIGRLLSEKGGDTFEFT